MKTASDLLPGRFARRRAALGGEGLLRRQIDDERLSRVISPHAPLLTLFEGTLHGEGPAWQATQSPTRSAYRSSFRRWNGSG